MKKNFKFMLVALLATFGFSNATAQELHLGSTVTDAVYKYTLLDDPVATGTDKYTANVEITEVRAGKDPVQADKSIYLPENGQFVSKFGSEEYTFTVTHINAANLPLKNLSTATSVIIPATIKAIPESCFEGCSDMTSITFADGSLVETIGTHAFATTKITDFDFEPCTKLAELPDEVFVQALLNNTYITTVTLPKSPLFKHINGAFKNLTKLTTINNLESSYIQEVIAEAFDGCLELTELSLPGLNLRYIDKIALKGSNIETLSIDVSSLLNLGGGTVDPITYEYTGAATTNNIYDQGAIDGTPLTSLTLTGTLKGIISAYAFAYCDDLSGVLDFSGMTFGSTGQIAANAFSTCYDGTAETGIEGVTIGDIENNATGGYTIAAGAFDGCDYLATVTIGDVKALNAIGAAAFGDQLKDVTIGSVITSGAAFATGAFVWGDFSGATLTLANGEGEYLSQTSADDLNPAIAAGTFNFSAVVNGGLDAAFVYPTVTIGEIQSKGGAFAAKAIVPAGGAFEAFVFDKAIAANGIDVAIVDATTTQNNITALTFNGTIGAAGIATGAFAAEEAIATVTFNETLAEGAVASRAFFADGTPESPITDLYYTKNGIADYTVNPFAIDAFDATGTADVNTDRTIKFHVTDENLAANFKSATVGVETTGKFGIYLVLFYEEPVVIPTTFRVYQNGSTNVAWGRYDLGSFTVEKGPENAYVAATNGMIIPRYQDVVFGEGEEATTARVKLTLYGTYGDENEDGGVEGDGESLVYMVPLQVFEGNYEIEKTNLKTIIVKAEAIDGTFADKDIEIAYEDAALTYNSVWASLPNFGAPRGFAKNTTPNVITTQILWDGTQIPTYDVWGIGGVDHDLPYAPYAIYSLSNPANYKGIDVVKLLVSSTSGKIGLNWYYMFMRHFGDYSAAARVIWLSDGEATAIFGVKENAKVAAENGAMYNLQGVRISAPRKGQLYIMNGKKYIAK